MSIYNTETEKTIFCKPGHESCSVKSGAVDPLNKYVATTGTDGFMKIYKFSSATRSYLDKICRITDGAGADRYTLFQFLQTFNQNMVHSIYQPNKPNDDGLFKLWKDKLVEKGVTFQSGEEIMELIKDQKSSTISHVVTRNKDKIPVNILVFATPLNNLTECVENSSPDVHSAFGPLSKLQNYTYLTSYEPYLSMTFHWNNSIEVKDIWGGGFGPWGMLWIKLSDYFGKDQSSHTLISACIIKLDVKSPVTNKTAHETVNTNELINEAFRQINEAHGNILPEPNHSVMYSGVERENNKWKSTDYAYMKTIHSYSFPYKSPKFDNLFSVGSHNEQSAYAFTSMESAVSNSIVFCHKFDRRSKKLHPIRNATTLVNIIQTALVCILVTILFRIYNSF